MSTICNLFKTHYFQVRIALIFVCLIFSYTVSQAQWVQTNGPYGGEIVCSAGSGNVLVSSYTADLTWAGQLFNSTDSGNTWTPVFDVKNTTFTGIVFHDTSIYVCAMDSGIFISNDDGLTWYNGTSALANDKFYDATVCDDKLFACGNGVYKTEDGGVSWTSVSTGLSTTNDILDIASDSLELFAISAQEVYRSSDLGQNWQVVNNGITGIDFSHLATHDSTVIIGTFSDGVYVSNDLGQTWLNTYFTGSIVRNVGFHGDTLLVLIEDSVYHSTDGGLSWSSINAIAPGLRINQVTNYNTQLLISTDGGLYTTSFLGDTCTLIGLPAVDVVDMGGFGDVIFAGTIYENGPSAGIVVSKDNGETWSTATTGLPGQPHYANKAQCFLGWDNKMLVSWRNDGLFLSADTGSTWLPCLNGIPAGHIPAMTIYQGIIYAINDSAKIYSSIDSAQTWSLFSSIPIATATINLSEIEIRDSVIFVCGGGATGFWISHNFGQSWVTSNNGLNCLNVWEMAIQDSVIVAATQPDGMYISHDKGLNWNWINLNLTIPWCSDVTIVNNLILAATSGNIGVISSSDTGSTWNGFNAGLYPKFETYTFRRFYQNDDYLFVSTGGGRSRFSIYKIPVSQLTGISEAPVITNELLIFPNPNNGSFTITAPSEIFGHGTVKLTVYDYAGKNIINTEIATDVAVTSKALEGRTGVFILTLTSAKATRSGRIVANGR
jgi:photosystem II stability/assembly factor-like uncharacterized protein